MRYLSPRALVLHVLPFKSVWRRGVSPLKAPPGVLGRVPTTIPSHFSANTMKTPANRLLPDGNREFVGPAAAGDDLVMLVPA